MATAAFTSPSPGWLKALQCFVLRLQREEAGTPPQPHRPAWDSGGEQPGNKRLPQTIWDAGRRKAEQKERTSFAVLPPACKKCKPSA